MRKAVVPLMVAAFGFMCCSGEPDRAVTHRGRDGRPDQWVYRIDKDTYKIAIDTNGDGRPDLVKTYKNNQMVEIESDRNFDGQTDLVQVYSHGDLIREIHDDDFDGKPEKIEEFRHGKLAIVERDPQERGDIDIVEYYDDSGKLIRREVRQK
jgi:antitoxin component YwqK of YwqJK toxin-antitoxin module